MSEGWRAPTLHVIYAGRGDAFLLEYGPQNNREFIVIDGGPRNFHSGSKASQAPYHRYFKSACESLLASRNRDNFSGVIISHPDEDHYGGMLHGLGARLAEDVDVPIFVPSNSSSSYNDCKAIDSVILAGQRVQGFLAAADPDASPLIGPLYACFPPPQAIRFYSAKNDARLREHGQFNVGLSKNARSILLHYQTPGVANQIGMFFTGDSNATTIATNMARAIPDPANRRFSIYKVQHHGSREDSQLEPYAPLYYYELQHESLVYALLRVHADEGFIPNNIDRTVVRKAAELLVDLLLAHYKDDTSKADAYYEKLGSRNDMVQLKLQTLKKPAPGEEETAVGIAGDRLRPDPSKLLPKLNLAMAAMEVSEVGTRTQWNAFQAAWTKFRDGACTWELTASLQVSKTREFYETFQSDVYVVSANSKYAHPRPEFLLGLALAVKNQDRKAILYATAGHSIDVDTLGELTVLCNQGTLQELFFGDHLRIAYLNYGTYMSLNGDTQSHPGADRELGSATEFLNITEHAQEERMKLWQRLEREPDVVLRKSYYVVAALPDNSVFYLTLMRSDGVLAPDLIPNPVTLWLGHSPVSEDYRTIECRLGQTDPEAVTLTFLPAGSPHGPDACYIGFYDDGEKVIYIGHEGVTYGYLNETTQENWVLFRLASEPVNTIQEEAHSGSINVFQHGLESNTDQSGVSEGWVFEVAAEETPLYTLSKAESDTVEDSSVGLTISGAKSKKRRAAHRDVPGEHPTQPQVTSELGEFLKSQSAIRDVSSLTLENVLTHVLGQLNTKSLFSQDKLPKYMASILASNADLKGSTVDWTRGEFSAVVTRAIIIVRPTSPHPRLTIDGKDHQIAKATLKVDWHDPKQLALTVGIKTVDDLHISSKVKVPAATQSQLTLRQALLEIDHQPAPDVKGPTLTHFMAVILGSKEKVRDRLGQQLPAFLLRHGFAELVVDLDQSVAEVSSHPVQRKVLKNAVLVCRPATATSTPEVAPHKWPLANPSTSKGSHEKWAALLAGIQLGDFRFSLEGIRVRIENSRLATEKVTVEAEVTLLKTAKTGITLSLSSTLEADGCVELSFRAKTGSIHQLVEALSSTTSGDILNVKVPLQDEKSFFRQKEPSLHEFGFTLKQPVDGIASYTLSNIYAKTTFSDWFKFLPDPSKFKDVEAIATVSVWNPLRSKSRRAGVDIYFRLPVPASKTTTTSPSTTQFTNMEPKFIHAKFAATPLAGESDYEYTLWILGTGPGVTLAEVAAAIGLHDISQRASKELPALTDALNKIHIKELGVTVEKAGSKWAFAEWVLDVYVPSIELIPGGILKVTDVSLRLEKILEEIRAKGKASFYLQKAEKISHVSFEFPSATLGTEGYVLFDSPNGLSLSDVFQNFRLGSVSDVPVLGEVASVHLTQCRVGFGSDAHREAQLQSFTASFRKEALVVGPVELRALEFSISWKRLASRPGDNGKAEQKAKGVLGFTASAQLGERGVRAEVSLDGEKQLLSIAISSNPDKPITVAEILKLLLPDTSSALHETVEHLTMRRCKIELDLEDHKIVSGFHLEVVDGSTLELPTTSADKPLKLKSLKIDYTRGKNQEQVLTPAKPDQKGVVKTQGGISEFAVFATAESQGTTLNVALRAEANPKTEHAVFTFRISATKAENMSDARLSRLAGDFGLDLPAIEKPEGCPAFNGSQLEVMGKFDRVPTETAKSTKPAQGHNTPQGKTPKPASSLKMTELSLKVSTNHVMALLDDPEIRLERLYINVEYTRGKPISALVRGFLRLSDSATADLLYAKYKDGHAFQAIVERNHDPSVNTSGVVGRFLKEGDVNMAKGGSKELVWPLEHLSVTLRPKKSLVLIAKGAKKTEKGETTHPFQGTCCGVKFSLHNVGIRLKITSTATVNPKAPVQQPASGKQKKYQCEVFLCGKLEMPGFISASAMLDVGSARESLLTAELTRLRSNINESQVKLIADEVSQKDGAGWDKLAGQPKIFHMQTGAKLVANFTTGVFTISGQIEGIGAALFLAKTKKKEVVKGGKPTSKTTFVFSVLAHDLHQIWQGDDVQDVSSAFQINKLAMQVVTYDGTVKQLGDDLEAAAKALQRDWSVLDADLMEQPSSSQPSTGHPSKEPEASKTAQDVLRLASPLGDHRKVTTGAWFFAEIGLGGTSEMANALSLCAGNPNIVQTQKRLPKPSATLFAYMPADTKREFGIIVKNFMPAGVEVLPNGVTRPPVLISGSGIYMPAEKSTGKHDVAPAGRRLKLSADIEIQGLRALLRLRAALTLDRQRTEIIGELTKETLENPFEDMHCSVILNHLKINGIITQKERQLCIAATATFHSSPDHPLTTEIHFNNDKPRLLLIKYGKKQNPTADAGQGQKGKQIPAASGEDLFKDIINNGNKEPQQKVEWPKELPAVVLEEAFIYYNAGSTFSLGGTQAGSRQEGTERTAARTFNQGFWIGAKLNIFDKLLAIEAHLEPLRGGLDLVGTYEQPIDLKFAQFVGYKDPKGKGDTRAAGPRLHIQAYKNTGKFELQAGLRFLDSDVASIDFQYDSKHKAYTGNAVLEKDPVKGVKMGFVYKNGKFHIESWGFDHLFDDFDLNDAINFGSKNTECGEIVEKMFHKLVKTEFHMNLKAPMDVTKIVDEVGPHVLMHCSYTISIAGISEPLGTISVGDLNLTIHKPWGIDNFWKRVLTELKLNLKEIGTQLLKNPDILGKVVGKMAVEKFAVETIKKLICRGVNDNDFMEKSRLRTWSAWDEVLLFLDRVRRLLGLIEEAAKGSRTIRVVIILAELLEVIFIVIVIIVIILYIIEALIKYFQERNEKAKVEELQDLKSALEKQHRDLVNKEEAAAAKVGEFVFAGGAFKATFAKSSSTKVEVTWRGLEGSEQSQCLQALKWEVTYSLNSQFAGDRVRTFTLPDRMAHSHEHSDEVYHSAKEVFVRVRAIMTIRIALPPHAGSGEMLTDRTIEQVTTARHLLALQPPTAITLRSNPGYPEATVSFRVNAGQSRRYEVEVAAVSSAYKHALHRSILVSEPSQSSITHDLVLISRQPGDFEGTSGPVRARVRLLSDNAAELSSEWVESAETITAKRYIHHLSSMMFNEEIKVAWDKVDFESYKIIFYDSTDRRITSFDAYPKTSHDARTEIKLDVPRGIAEGQIVKMAVGPRNLPNTSPCPVFHISTLTVYYVPVAKIVVASRTALRLDRNELTLKLIHDFAPIINTIQFEATDAQGRTKILAFHPGDGNYETFSTTAILRKLERPYPKSICVITADSSGKHVVRGPQWTLNAGSGTLAACQNLKAQAQDGKLALSWNYAYGVHKALIQVLFGVREVERVHSRNGGHSGVVEVFNDIEVLSANGEPFDITITPKEGEYVYGKPTSIIYRPPRFTLWSTPQSIQSECQLASQSNFTTPAPRNQPILVFHDARRGMVAETLKVDGGRASLTFSSRGRSFRSEGTVFASSSLGEAHQEVYWIDALGSINGLVNSSPDPSIYDPWRTGAYQFGTPGEAVTDHGGAITAVADPKTGTIHLWWVARGNFNTVHYASCKPNVWWSSASPWTASEHEVYLDDKCITPLAAAIAPGGWATVWYRPQWDGLASVTRRHGQPATGYCVYDYSSNDVTGMVNIYERQAPQSGICAITTPAGLYRVFWITYDGSVASSLTDPSLRAGLVPGADKSRVVPPGSASTRSDIAVILDASGNDLRVWWFAEDGSLMGAKADDGKAKKPSWTVYQQAPPGSGRTVGRMHVIATRAAGGLPLRVWWIGADNKIKFQSPL